MIIALAPMFFLIHLNFSSCCSDNWKDNDTITGYDLTAPDKILVLPESLREISGLTVIDSATVACVQDENGILFMYDISKNIIKYQYVFHDDGDYEGVTRVGGTLYVLRSDGTLFEISDFESKTFKTISRPTHIPSNNNEGLCYDQGTNRLLIACKGKTGKGHASKDKRVIYGFDIKAKALTENPILEFDLNAIKQFALSNKIKLPTKTKKTKQITESTIKFRTSAISIHPLTKKLYLLSASDHLLFIFNMNGSIELVEQLNPIMFNKAEGITFLENGDMLITNEGEDKKPTILRFNYRKK